MTNPAHSTDPAWAAREAWRLALEEAAQVANAERRKQEALLSDPLLLAMQGNERQVNEWMCEVAADTAADIETAIRALAGKYAP